MLFDTKFPCTNKTIYLKPCDDSFWKQPCNIALFSAQNKYCLIYRDILLFFYLFIGIFYWLTTIKNVSYLFKKNDIISLFIFNFFRIFKY